MNVIHVEQFEGLGELQIPLRAPICVLDDFIGRARNRAVLERIERVAINLAPVFLQVFPVGVVQTLENVVHVRRLWQVRHHEKDRVERFPLIEFGCGNVQRGLRLNILRPNIRRRVVERLADVLFLEIGMLGDDLRWRHAVCDEVDDMGDRDS